MPSRAGLALAAVLIGAVDALVFLGFEWLVHHGTDWIWNDLFDTDSKRWAVIPVGMALSLAFSVVLRAVRERRVVHPHTNLLPADDASPPSLGGVGVILVVGLTSLLAGASLGPELPLVAAAAAIGALVATRASMTPALELLVLSSVGALLVAFLGSLVPIALPLLLLLRKRRLSLGTAVPPVLAGAAAFGMLYLIKGNDEGFGTVPVGASAELHDYPVAIVLGVLGALVAAGVKQLMVVVEPWDERAEQRLHWAAAALLFGAVLGLLYLIGGQEVQFSGSEGTVMLLQDHADDTALALLALAAVKLVVTAWSVAAGYRGGVIFPSVFAAIAVSLAVAQISADLAGPGATIGILGGLLVALVSPSPGGLILLAVLPAELLGVGLAGAAGGLLGGRLFRRLIPPDAAGH